MLLNKIQIKYILLLPLLFLWSAQTLADALPDLGGRGETFITLKEEKNMGKEFMKEIRATTTIVNDMIIDDYIQHLGNRLASNANTKRKKFNFFVIDDSTFNAFAGPDANIGIHSGTIIAANSESELAAVMAHEIAHVTQHHIERLIESAKNTQIAATAGMLAAMIIGLTVNSKSTRDPITGKLENSSSSVGDLATGLAMSSIGGAVQHMINFTRAHEIEADNIGMKILYKSAFDPKAMPSIFERMQRLHYDYAEETPKFLLTHPVTNDRIAETKNRANQYQPKDFTNPEIFNLIRARTWTLTAKNQKILLQYPKNSAASQYAEALNLYEKSQLTAAIKIATNLQKEYPNEILFKMLAAQLKMANKQTDEALATLKTSLDDNADYYPLIILYAQALLTAKHSQEACDFLKAKTRKYQDDTNLYHLLARAYAQNNQLAYAYQAKAKAYALEEYNRQAIMLLQQALKTSKLSTIDRAIINAKIEQLKEIEKNS